jgi:hypothetical protein
VAIPDLIDKRQMKTRLNNQATGYNKPLFLTRVWHGSSLIHGVRFSVQVISRGRVPYLNWKPSVPKDAT